MCLENWDDTAAVTNDRQTWSELCSLRFIDGGHNVVIMGPVRMGKTFLATAWATREPPALQRALRAL